MSFLRLKVFSEIERFILRIQGFSYVQRIFSNFAENVTTSRQDLLGHRSIPTTRAFSRDKEVSLRILQAVSPVPSDFGSVASIIPKDPGTLSVTSDVGITIDVPAQWDFVTGPS